MTIHCSATHQVLNQAGPATGWNAFSDDAVLRGVVTRGAPWVADKAAALGAYAGEAEMQELARLANRHGPELRTHDRFGHRRHWCCQSCPPCSTCRL
jgi:putative acyl-CoA dehydrogenase